MLQHICYFLLILVAVNLAAENTTTTTAKPSVRNSNNTTLNSTTQTTLAPTTVKLLLKQEVNVENNKVVNASVNATDGTNSTGTDRVQLSGVYSVLGEGVGSYFKQLFQTKQGIGHNCSKQEDCEGTGSLCLEGTCQCQDGYVAAIDKWHCLKVVSAIGKDCIQDAQCYKGLNLKEGDAMCVSFKCVCGTDTIYRDGTCIKSIYLGDKCVSDNDCLTINSHCLQGVCACPMDMVPGAENKHCLPAIKSMASSTCSQDDQCQQFMGDNSLCHEERCQCKSRTHFNGTMCIQDLKLGESCSEKMDCITSTEYEQGIHARDCVEQRCSCLKGFKEVIDEDACFNSAPNLFGGFLIILMMFVTSAWI